MITKKITYEGLQGSITDEFLFHISQAQILELNLPYIDEEQPEDPNEPVGLAKVLQSMVDSSDNLKVYQEMKKIVLMAVGKKSDDGRRFLKSEEIRQDFENTEAYSELIIELMEDSDKAAAFFQGIMPEKVQEGARKLEIDAANAAGSQKAAATPTPTQDSAEGEPVVTPEARTITHAELAGFDPAELQAGLANGSLVIAG